jgi:hypothetical protein
MISKLKHNNSQKDIDDFAKSHPERYDNLIQIIGKYVLIEHEVHMSIDLPCKGNEDCGCILVTTPDEKVVLGCKHF